MKRECADGKIPDSEGTDTPPYGTEFSIQNRDVGNGASVAADITDAKNKYGDEIKPGAFKGKLRVNEQQGICDSTYCYWIIEEPFCLWMERPLFIVMSTALSYSNGMKKLPNPSERNLIPPDMDYVYFEESGNHPLEPEMLEYSAVNSWWLAECAFLAYCHPGFARMALKLAGFDGFRFFGATGTECMVSWNNHAVITAFRGTELKSVSALHEIRTDLNAIPVPFKQGGKVHRGFLKGLEEIWGGFEGLQVFLDDLTAVNPDRPLLITGHSLGGAMAALCFARTPQAKGLYTYGAPRIGDSEFVKLFEGRSVWRIENARDPVPLVPPDIPSISFNFGDIGTLKFLDWDGAVLDKRPVFILEDHKARYREAKTTFDDKLKEISRTMSLSKKGLEVSRKILNEIKQHTQLTNKEWKMHMQGLLKDFGLSVDEHQPIFYATKTWNALVGG